MIDETPWIYKISNWDVKIDDDLIAEIENDRLMTSKLMTSHNENKRKLIAEDKKANIKLKLIVSGNQDDIMTKDNIKDAFGIGYTLTDVSKILNVPSKRNKALRFISGVRLR